MTAFSSRYSFALLSGIALLLPVFTSCSNKPAEQTETETATATSSAEPASSDAATETADEPQAAPVDMEAILEEAETEQGQEQYVAIDDLGEHHEDASDVVPALLKMLSDDDPQVRWRSARALGDFGEQAKAAAPQLQAMLKEDNPVMQFHAAATLGKIGDKSDETVDALVTAATNKDGRVARTAIAALRHLQPGPERVMKAFDQVLASDDKAVVVHALEALVERGGDACPVLNAALGRPRTAYIACTAIAQIGPDAAPTVPALTELLGKTKHSQLLIQTLLALGAIGPASQPAVPQIIPMLDHETDATVPVAAAYALGRIGDKSADAPLRAAIAKPNDFLQMVASWALAKIHPDDADLKKQAMDKLEAGLKSDDPSIKAAAEKGIMSLQPPADAAPQQ